MCMLGFLEGWNKIGSWQFFWNSDFCLSLRCCLERVLLMVLEIDRNLIWNCLLCNFQLFKGSSGVYQSESVQVKESSRIFFFCLINRLKALMCSGRAWANWLTSKLRYCSVVLELKKKKSLISPHPTPSHQNGFRGWRRWKMEWKRPQGVSPRISHYNIRCYVLQHHHSWVWLWCSTEGRKHHYPWKFWSECSL